MTSIDSSNFESLETAVNVHISTILGSKYYTYFVTTNLRTTSTLPVASIMQRHNSTNICSLAVALPEKYPDSVLKRIPIWPLIDLMADDQMATGTDLFQHSKQGQSMSSIKQIPDESTISSDVPTRQTEEDPHLKPGRGRMLEYASRTVINTTELFEMILSDLPMADIYLSRKVCRRWKTVVDSSPTLRRRMWISTSEPAIRPLVSPPYGKRGTKFILNPILDRIKIFTTAKSNSDECYHQHWFCNIHFPPRWQISDAPWRGMQITNPPIKRVFLRSNWLEKYVEAEDGITAGMIANLLEFQVGRLYFRHC